eukprot:3841413-Alexandrium_andersonii.AAC.1
MSASLVGSEMCIRDRPWGMRRSTTAQYCKGGARTAWTSRRVPRSTRQRSCLLYTSDAADDM